MASAKPLAGGPTGKLRGVPNNLKMQSSLPPHVSNQTQTMMAPHVHQDRQHMPGQHLAGMDPMIGGPPPVIFVGHVGRTTAMVEHCSITVPNAHEIFLGGAYLLAGVHVVPNQISTPVQGLGFAFEGKTKPELHVAPFLLKIFGRNLDTNELTLLQETQIQGGVQWLPVFDAVSMRIAVDYLVFTGTFDTVSVIVHGAQLERSFLSEAARNCLDTEPIRKLVGNVEDDDSGDEEGSGGAVSTEIELANQKRVNAMLEYYFQRLERVDKAVQHHLGSLVSPSAVARSALRCCCISRSGLVSLACASTLVGKIFSLDFNAYSSSKADTQAGLLKELDESFCACWASAAPSTDKDESSFATVESSLDQEAASLVAGFLQQCLQQLLAAIHADKASGSKLVGRDREPLVSALLLCCNACLVNEFFAAPFVACGGPALLIELTLLLTQDSTKAVSALLAKALRCLKVALLHEVIAGAFLRAPPQGGPSGYQQLLAYYKGLRVANVPAQLEQLCEDILNWCAHADALSALRQRCQLALNDIPLLAEATALQFSHYNLHTSQAATVDDEPSETGGRDDRIDVACGKVGELLGGLLESLDECARAAQVSAKIPLGISSILVSRQPGEGGEASLLPAALLALQQSHSFIASLAVVAAVMRSAGELAAGADWRAPGGAGRLASRSAALREALLAALLRVLRGDHADLLLAQAPAESRLLAQFLCSRDDVYAACISPAEIACGYDLAYSHLASASVGRALELSLAVTALVNTALVNSEQLLRQPQVGEELSNAGNQELRALQDCLRQLAQISEDRIGACVVSECVVNHLLPALLAAVRADSPVTGIGESAARLGVDASLLLRLCAERVDHWPVARCLRDHAAAVAGALRAVAGGSLFDMQSKGMKDNVLATLALLAFDTTPDEDALTAAVTQFNLQVLNNGSAVNSADLRRLLVAVNLLVAVARGGTPVPALARTLAPLAEMLVGALVFFATPSQQSQAGSELLLAMEMRRADGVCPSREKTNMELLCLLLVSCLQGLVVAGVPADVPVELLLQTALGAHSRVLAAGTCTSVASYCDLGDMRSLARRASGLCVQLTAMGVELAVVAKRGLHSPALLVPSLVLARAIAESRPLTIAALCADGNSSALVGLGSSEVMAEDPLGSILVSSAAPSAIGDLCALVLAGQASSQLEARRCSRALLATACASSAANPAAAARLASAWCLGLGRHCTHLLLVERTSAGEEPSDELRTETASVARLLVDAEQLLSSPPPCLDLLERGALFSLCLCLHSNDKDVVILALQALVAAYRCMARMSLAIDKAASSADPQSLRGRLLACMEGLMDAVVSLLPSTISKFQDKDSISLWMQASLLLQLVPLKHLKLFLAALSPTVGIEVLGVKLWQAFEDSFQGLMELTDVLKAASTAEPRGAAPFEALLAEDRGQKALIQAHRQLGSAVVALKAVTEVAIGAFCQGYIAAPTLSKVIRYHLTDPKKAAHRFQRSYTMWSTQVLQERHQSMYHLGVFVDAAAGCGSDGCDPLYADAFEATHAVVVTSLKHLVDSLGRATRLAQSREEKVVQQVPPYSIGDASKGLLELTEPLGSGGLQEWLHLGEGNAAQQQQQQQQQHDLLHGLLRRHILAGLYVPAEDDALRGVRRIARGTQRKQLAEKGVPVSSPKRQKTNAAPLPP